MATETYDVLVVGAGAAGLTAALRSSALGMKTLLIEKQTTIGGTTMLSGGTIWIPDNHLAKCCGIHDSLDLGRRYLAATIGKDTPPDQRQEAFLKHGPKMVECLADAGVQFNFTKPLFPDYHPDLDGGLPHGGRTIEPAIFDASRLGSSVHELALPESLGPLVDFKDFRILTRPRASVLDFIATRWMLLQSGFRRLRGLPVSMGSSLVAQLFFLCKSQSGLTVYTNTCLQRLTMEGGDVVGATVERNDSPLQVRTTAGVVLAAAGFARNKTMRQGHLQAPFTTQWTLTARGGDTGDGLSAGVDAGAAHALTTETWGIPVIEDPHTGRVTQAIFEMTKPHCIVVDNQGSRFFSEAQPYGDASRALFNRHDDDAGKHAWLILDANHRQRYTLGSLDPGADLSRSLETDRMLQASTLQELAQVLHLDEACFSETIRRWNAMCENGVDEDFQKGKDAYQRFLGDPNVQPNPNMGPLSEAPFYAIAIRPGDAGTKGGLLTDEHARVVRREGGVIKGLYAVGNTAASIMGESSIGAGVTLGPAMTFAYLAAEHLRNAWLGRPAEASGE